MAYLSLKYCGKSVKTYAGNLGHITMSHRFFFLKVVIDAIKMSITFLFFAFVLHEYSPAKSPPSPRDHYPPTLRITLQPSGSSPPNLEDYPPTLEIITPQP